MNKLQIKLNAILKEQKRYALNKCDGDKLNTRMGKLVQMSNQIESLGVRIERGEK